MMVMMKGMVMMMLVEYDDDYDDGNFNSEQNFDGVHGPWGKK